MDGLVCAAPLVCTMLSVHPQPFPSYGSLRLMRGPTPASPFTNIIPTVATDRLVCAQCCVCTMLCVHRQVRMCRCPMCNRQPFPRCSSLRSMPGLAPAPPFNTMTPAVATDRLVSAPPLVRTILSVHRRRCPGYGSLCSIGGPALAPP